MEDRIQKYRETIRHLFNSSFLPEIESTDDFNEKWDIVDVFKTIEATLLDVMVLGPLDISGKLNEPLDGIRIVPKYNDSQINVENPKGDNNRYWDHEFNRASPDSIELCFIEFFDFDQTGMRDYKYYRAKILSCNETEVVGREALCPIEYYRVEQKS